MKDVIDFLELNGFVKTEGSYSNSFCTIDINQNFYGITDNCGNVVYSTSLNIYWLIGTLTYYGLMDKDYKQENGINGKFI